MPLKPTREGRRTPADGGGGQRAGQGAARPGWRTEPPSSSTTPLSQPPPTLSEIGITRDQSSRYQQIAAIPRATFETAVQAHKAADEPVNIDGITSSRNAAFAGDRPSPRVVHTVASCEGRRSSQVWTTESRQDLRTLLRIGGPCARR